VVRQQDPGRDDPGLAYDLQFSVAGPAMWNATQKRYLLKPVLEFKAMQGWTMDSATGQLINRAKPAADTIERVIPFIMKPDSGMQ